MKYTKDPVRALISKLDWMYCFYKEHNVSFENKTEYEIIKEILQVIETNNKPKKVLRLIK